jgi:hypothetical protein
LFLLLPPLFTFIFVYFLAPVGFIPSLPQLAWD